MTDLNNRRVSINLNDRSLDHYVINGKSYPDVNLVPVNRSGSVTVFNRSEFNIMFIVTFKLDGRRYREQSDIIPKELSQRMILPMYAENVKINILDIKTENTWISLHREIVNPREHSFFLTIGSHENAECQRI